MCLSSCDLATCVSLSGVDAHTHTHTHTLRCLPGSGRDTHLRPHTPRTPGSPIRHTLMSPRILSPSSMLRVTPPTSCSSSAWMNCATDVRRECGDRDVRRECGDRGPRVCHSATTSQLIEAVFWSLNESHNPRSLNLLSTDLLHVNMPVNFWRQGFG